MNADVYCRAVEAHLCRRNGGHLVRIVGPAFECVRGWAERGIPLKIAQLGIDRCVERHEAKGPRRRPVRVEFCEGDVLDSFDAWRRAIGVPIGGPDPAGAAAPGGTEPRRPEPLRMHLDRAVARLTALRGREDRALADLLDRLVRELDALRPAERMPRGAARAALQARLRALDTELLAGARAACAGALPEMRHEADDELAPYRTRLSQADYEQAREATIDRLVRARLGLPTLSDDA